VIFNACCCCLKYKYETVQNWLNTKEKGERLMKFYRVVFLVGGLALSAGIASVVAAECGPSSKKKGRRVKLRSLPRQIRIKVIRYH
jgi:hypothetical protein